MRSVINIGCLLLFISILITGQLLFKHTAAAFRGGSLTGGFANVLQMPTFYLALTLYSASTFLWIWILSRVPLSIAYSFMALSVLAIPLLSHWIFGEVIAPMYWLGAVLISVGFIIIQISA